MMTGLLQEFVALTLQHLVLVGVSMLLAAVIAIPLGIASP
jgi:ABC-type proline/glycine betaine transport system permease subunit